MVAKSCLTEAAPITESGSTCTDKQQGVHYLDKYYGHGRANCLLDHLKSLLKGCETKLNAFPDLKNFSNLGSLAKVCQYRAAATGRWDADGEHQSQP